MPVDPDDLHEGDRGAGELHVIRDLGSARRQGGIGRLDMDGGCVWYAGGHASKGEVISAPARSQMSLIAFVKDCVSSGRHVQN